ncbi:glycerol-3-phosphate 1-O-acyltransferase PlsY [Aerolutibacter daejeonensis]|uniref:glycerol-3-phosphate 1-O-acyltransferase PlsY n=1 Tax=Aerolutibacter daejeonensis TaxID=346181 RepID=UPI00056A3A0C|nr:glycerol-3-phosphate 1-O-acyltransferase PlsY [Lysobacter daejeonensis]
MSFADLFPSPATSALVVLAAYLLGSLSGSLLLGRLRGVDIRTQGSGNAGGTNAFRTQGAKFALGVVLVDIGKGALAAWLGIRFAPVAVPLAVPTHGYLAAFAAVLGHVWPAWHGFRGGKGAATLVGALLVLWPWALAAIVPSWLLVVVLTGYVGLATVLAVLVLPLLAWWGGAEAPRLAFAVAAAALLVFTHRANLQRLAAGTELRFAQARLLHRLRRGG